MHGQYIVHVIMSYYSRTDSFFFTQSFERSKYAPGERLNHSATSPSPRRTLRTRRRNMPMCGGNFRGNRDDCTVKRFTGVNWDGRGASASPPAERSLRDDMVHV